MFFVKIRNEKNMSLRKRFRTYIFINIVSYLLQIITNINHYVKYLYKNLLFYIQNECLNLNLLN